MNCSNFKVVDGHVKPRKMTNSVCLICGQNGYHTIIITSCHSCVTASGTPLAKFLIKVIGEEPCYSISKFICQQCFLLLDRLDTYQARAAEIHHHVSTRYKDTKYGYLGSRKRISELIVSSLTNMKNFKNGTTLNVSDELSVTVFHEALPRRGNNSLQRSAPSRINAFKSNSTSSHFFNINNNYLKRRRIVPKNFKGVTKRAKCFSVLPHDNTTENPDKDDNVPRTMNDVRVPSFPSPNVSSSGGSSSSSNNNKSKIKTDDTKTLTNSCPTPHFKSASFDVALNVKQPSPKSNSEESDCDDSEPTHPSTPANKLQNENKRQSSSGTSNSGNSSSSTSSSSSSSSSSSDGSSSSSSSSSSEESSDEEGTTLPNATDVKQPCKGETEETHLTKVDCNESAIPVCGSRQEKAEEGIEGEVIVKTEEHEESSRPNDSNVSDSNFNGQEMESIDSHLAEAVLMQNSFASNLLHSFLSTSLWMNSSDSSSQTIKSSLSKSQGSYNRMPRKNPIEDLTVDSVNSAVEFIKDKKKRLELKNTGQSYINTKGKLVEAKRVWPQDCSRCPLKCIGRLSEAMRLLIFADYWGLADYDLQREYLATHMEREERVGPSGHTRTVVLYFLSQEKKRFQVCRQFFLKTLDVSEKASRIVLEKKLKGELGVESNPLNVAPSDNNSDASPE